MANKPESTHGNAVKDRMIRDSKYLYGSAGRDYYLMRNPDSLPRYRHLSRKLLIHYAGSAYDPNTIEYTIEVFIRSMIRDAVEYKVFNQLKGYDREAYDNLCKKVIGELLNLDIPYDVARIEQGLAREFKAAIPINYDLPN